MTLPPDRIGDKGQRYIVRARGYPLPRFSYMQNIGYTDSLAKARDMMNSIFLNPCVDLADVFDTEYRQAGGVISSVGGNKEEDNYKPYGGRGSGKHR